MWKHAQPGTVEVLLVPNLPEAGRTQGEVTMAALRSQETETVRREIRADLDLRRPLGTTCLVSWARYKPVRVLTRIVVRRQENRDAVAQRVLARLHGLINPLPTPFNSSGWQFGQALRVSHVYDAALAEPGVQWVDQVRLFVQDIPQQKVNTLTADHFQPHTWYAGSGVALFRSLNDGDGWEVAAQFPDEEIQVVAAHPQRAGYVAVVTKPGGGEGARIHLSPDCGESWNATPTATAFAINDIAWTLHKGAPWLLLATNVGLYELAVAHVEEGAGPVQVLVDNADPDLGFYAVVTSWDLRGQASVALAAQKTQGVYLSGEGGRRDTFRMIGLQKTDIRTLAVQYDGPRAYLWAGVAAAGPDLIRARVVSVGNCSARRTRRRAGKPLAKGGREAVAGRWPFCAGKCWPRRTVRACCASTRQNASPVGFRRRCAVVCPCATRDAFIPSKRWASGRAMPV